MSEQVAKMFSQMFGKKVTLKAQQTGFKNGKKVKSSNRLYTQVKKKKTW